MSIASNAAMGMRNALSASQVEYERSKIDDYLHRANDKNNQLGALLSKYEGYLNMCESQLPMTLMNITSMMNMMSQQPQAQQNGNLANQLSMLQSRYQQLKQAYIQLGPRVTFLKTQVEKAHMEEQELLKKKKNLDIQYELSKAGEDQANKMQEAAIKRMYA